CYAFYELMKYPYEPRRSISAVFFIVYFQACTLYMPWAIMRQFDSKILRIAGMTFCLILITISIAVHGKHFVQYDAGGYRNQSTQADWPAMAEYLKQRASKEDIVATYSTSGYTWVSSQYGFYHRRSKVENPLRFLNTVPELTQLLSKAEVKGVW